MYKKENFGKNLRRTRQERGLSQREVGEAVEGRVYKTVRHWESGRSFPSVPVLIDLANYFGVTLDELFKE